MIRSTTPKQSFYFTVNPDTTFKEILITYAQNGKIVLEKEKEDLTFQSKVDSSGKETHEAWFRMTQEESNLFSHGKVDVQVKVLTEDDLVLANEKKTLPVRDVLNDKIMGEAEEPVEEEPVEEQI